MQNIIDTFARFEFLSGLPREVLEDLARMATEEKHHDGVVLFSEGSPANYLYLIVEGKISLENLVQLGRTGTPRRAATGLVGASQPVGWSALVSPYIYTSSGVCLEDTLVIALPGEEMRKLMTEQPEIGLELINRVAAVIRERLSGSTSTLTYFLSIVSHELKRPLAAVENYIQVLLGGFAGEITPKQKRLLERSSLRINDLRALISDLLDFARMQPDQIRADFELVSPQEVASESLEEVRLAASQKNIQVRAAGPTEFKPIVAARRRLRQVLSNLLANAIKFSPEGSTVLLSAQEDDEGLSIYISDEGIGIPAEDQEHIFDEFFRASNAEQVGGAGLGLSVTKRIIDAHEGTIKVESPYKPGKSGTRFTVWIPHNLPLPSQLGQDIDNPRSRAGDSSAGNSTPEIEREGT
ncbi:MAG: cyclic nucleotide-binding domain-containing protein [Anaerolineales bacterium]|nr:cyclic nucleotide-binding domain-containing protein [Anaerolineales bacterium]